MRFRNHQLHAAALRTCGPFEVGFDPGGDEQLLIVQRRFAIQVSTNGHQLAGCHVLIFNIRSLGALSASVAT